jgi:hypothetical protein
MKPYHYKECLLSNVWLADGFHIENDDAYGELFFIEGRLEELYAVIGKALVDGREPLNGAELAFLRRYCDLAQEAAELALFAPAGAVGEWESRADVRIPEAPSETMKALATWHFRKNGISFGDRRIDPAAPGHDLFMHWGKSSRWEAYALTLPGDAR